MADFQGSTTVAVSASALCGYLSDVSNLPRYFSRMTSARTGQGEEVTTTATLPDGAQVQGDAWFCVDENAERIEWGSRGPSGYSGSLDVSRADDAPHGGPATSVLRVHLHTTRVADGDRQVQDGITETLANIKRQAESGQV